MQLLRNKCIFRNEKEQQNVLRANKTAKHRKFWILGSATKKDDKKKTTNKTFVISVETQFYEYFSSVVPLD